jgi:hypothetical protein
VTSQFQESEIRLEEQLAELASKNPKAGWLLEEYRSTEKHANTALKYVLQNAPRSGSILPQTVKVETQPTAFMRAYAARDSMGTPLIYVNAGLRFLLTMLNYSLARAAFKHAILAGRTMNATMFAILNGYWPPGVDLLAEMEAMGEFSEDEKYFITAWIPSQIFFIVAREFAHHILWSPRQEAPPVRNVRLLNGKEIEVYRPSQGEELKADEIASDIWDRLDETLSEGFQGFTAGGLGALFGYFRILERYTQSKPVSQDFYPPAVDRYEQFRERLFNMGRVRSLQAMEETWTVAEIITKPCLEARELLERQSAEDGTTTKNKGEPQQRT